MAKILIADDEPSIALAVTDELLFEGFEVKEASDGLTAVTTALEWRPDVLLLDLMLPELNGYEVCRRLRPALAELWIIMLTSRGLEVDKVIGFEAGADDYVVKPFSLRELVARVRVGLRRRQPDAQRAVHSFGDLAVDLRSRTVSRAGVEIPLTRKEFDILALLLGRSGEVVSRDDFFSEVWGDDVNVTERVIDSHVASLRRKIEADPDNPQWILSVRGVGYRLRRPAGGS